jgi:hypothetical protein
MNLLSPTLPDFDLEEWRQRPYRERIRALAVHWVENGFGTPKPMYVVYVLKMAGYVFGGLAIIAATTPGIGGVSDFSTWWSEPIVLQKVVIWTLLFEVTGLGCASGALTLHFWPPIGAILHWLRPGTIRLPAWPDKVPFTKGDRRTVVDVALYAALLAVTVRALVAPEITASVLAPVAILLPLIGLRDKVIFLAARAEQYWSLILVFFFVDDIITGTMAVMLAVWWGAATSKLNHHFPSVVAVMMSNSPLMRSKRIKRAMYQDPPNDLRPSKWAALLAHGGTAVEYLIPAVLVFTTGGLPTQIALAIMVLFHLHILSTFPMGVPLEWNIFVIYAAFVVFGANAELTLFDLSSPLLIALLVAGVLLGPVLGNLRPERNSFLVAMRYYAGNWATTTWLFRPEAYERVDAAITKSAKGPEKQLQIFYDEPTSYTLLQIGQAWRAMHVSGRALLGLVPRAVDDPESYVIRDGEWTAGFLIGYNFGEGHFHHKQLLDAIAARVDLEPGDLRVITLESQPILEQRQRWEILDAVDGKLDEGYVEIKDLVEQQPWLDGDGALPVRSLMHPERATPPWPAGPAERAAAAAAVAVGDLAATGPDDEEVTRIPEMQEAGDPPAVPKAPR